MLPVVLEELIMSFLKTCKVCYKTYADNMFVCEETWDSDCEWCETCDDCREVYMTHEGPMCPLLGELWEDSEFHS